MFYPLYCCKNDCARTDTTSLPISEVCNGTDEIYMNLKKLININMDFLFLKKVIIIWAHRVSKDHTNQYPLCRALISFRVFFYYKVHVEFINFPYIYVNLV